MRTPSVVCRREPVGSCRRTSSRDMRDGNIQESPAPTWPLPTTATTSSATAPILSPACRTRSLPLMPISRRREEARRSFARTTARSASCARPTPTRQLEALADWLHAQFAADPGNLGRRHATAAPLIADVFDSLLPSAASNGASRAFWPQADKAARSSALGLVELVTGRATPFEVLGLRSRMLRSASASTSETRRCSAPGFAPRATATVFPMLASLISIPSPMRTSGEITLSRAVERLVMGFALSCLRRRSALSHAARQVLRGCWRT